MDAERREYLEMQLSAYLDGELTPKEQAEVEAWLASDPQARALFSQLRATATIVQALPRARASEDLLSDLRTRLERKALLETGAPAELVTRSSTLAWGRWVAVAAVLALTVTAGYFSWTLRSENAAGPQYVLNDKADRLRDKADQPEGLPLARRGEVQRERFKQVSKSLVNETPAAAPVPAPASPPLPVVSLAEAKSAKQSDADGDGVTDRLLLKGGEVAGKNGGVSSNASVEAITGGAMADGIDGRSLGANGALDAFAEAGKKEHFAFDLSHNRIAGDDGALTLNFVASSAPAATDSTTRVLVMKFADADSRAKVVDALQRELLTEVAKHRTAAPGGRASPAAEMRVAKDGKASELGAKRPEGSAPPAKPASDSGWAEGAHRLDEFQTHSGQAFSGSSGREESVRLRSVQSDKSLAVNVLRFEAGDQGTADRFVAILNEQARAGGTTVVTMGSRADSYGYGDGWIEAI